MRRLLRRVIQVLVVLVSADIAYATWSIPERTTLDAAARAGAPGKFATLSAGVTHYELSGPDSGRLAVLVHGFSVPYYIWDSTVVALTGAGYRVLRYDLYGRGYSDRPDVAYSGALFDQQLDDLLDSLHVTTPVDLVGLSFGGFVTAHYAAGHAARLRTLTFVDPVAGSPAPPSIFRWPVLGLWLWNVTQLPGKAESQTGDFLHPEHYPGWADKYRPQMRYKGFGRALLSSATEASRVPMDTIYGAVAKTGVPTMLIWGKQDQTVPFPLSDVVRRAIPAIEFVPVDSAGHLPHIEQSRTVHARFLAFLGAHAAK